MVLGRADSLGRVWWARTRGFAGEVLFGMIYSTHRLLPVLHRRAQGRPGASEWFAQLWPSGRGSRVSTCTQRADMHGSSEAVVLAARTPAQATPPPQGHRDPRREDQQADRPAQ